MEEIWKDIQGYEGLYRVSNLGRVKSFHKAKEHILSPGKDKDGYFQVQLYKNGINKMRKVHRLVAQAFISNPNNLPQINHKDENKQNNNVDNLEWCTNEYNHNYGTAVKRAAEKRRGWIGLVGEKNPMYGRTGNKNPMYGRTGEKNPVSRKVICLNNLKIFNSIKEASEYANVTNIRSCLCGKSSYCGKIDNIKLVWEYYDNYLKMTDEEIKEKIDKSTRRKPRKRKKA